MIDEDRTLPRVLAEAHNLPFSSGEGGYYFEPYNEFMWSVETLRWWRMWINDPDTDTVPFRVFGDDGTGGLAAFWVRDSAEPVETQPVVFLGSEGELTAIARDLGDYLWLIANGFGPVEVVDGIDRSPDPIPSLVALAQRYTGRDRRSTAEIVEAAKPHSESLMSYVLDVGVE